MPNNEMSAEEIIDKWINPLGLMPAEEAALFTDIAKAIVIAREQGREEGLWWAIQAARCVVHNRPNLGAELVEKMIDEEHRKTCHSLKEST